MDGLKIVRGNDFYLRIPVYRASPELSGSGVYTAQNMALDECSNLSVSLLCGCGKTVSLSFSLCEGESGVIVTRVPGNLQCGWYGIEICGVLCGHRFRSYERKVFKIVENNGSSYVSASTYGGERSYQVDMMWVLYSCPSYPHVYLNLSDMTLRQRGTVENGRMYIDDSGNLCLKINE